MCWIPASTHCFLDCVSRCPFAFSWKSFSWRVLSLADVFYQMSTASSKSKSNDEQSQSESKCLALCVTLYDFHKSSSSLLSVAVTVTITTKLARNNFIFFYKSRSLIEKTSSLGIRVTESTIRYLYRRTHRFFFYVVRLGHPLFILMLFHRRA